MEDEKKPAIYRPLILGTILILAGLYCLYYLAFVALAFYVWMPIVSVILFFLGGAILYEDVFKRLAAK